MNSNINRKPSKELIDDLIYIWDVKDDASIENKGMFNDAGLYVQCRKTEIDCVTIKTYMAGGKFRPKIVFQESQKMGFYENYPEEIFEGDIDDPEESKMMDARIKEYEDKWGYNKPKITIVKYEPGDWEVKVGVLKIFAQEYEKKQSEHNMQEYKAKWRLGL
jgi:hypothetical protein